MRFLIILCLFFLPLTLPAMAKKSCQEEKPKCIPQSPCVFLPASSPCDTCQENPYQFSFTATIDFLYWQAKERGLEYAIASSAKGLNLEGKTLEPKFDFEPAVRVGLDFNMPLDNWDLAIDYTHFKTSSLNTAEFPIAHPRTISGPGLIPVWIHPDSLAGESRQARYQNASARWRLHMDIFEGLFSSPFCVGKAVSFTPKFGLKNAYIGQHYSLKYSNGNLIPFLILSSAPVLGTSTYVKSSAAGIGPSFGFDTHWNLGKNWNLFFHFLGSLLYTHFKLFRTETDMYFAAARIVKDAARLKQDFWSYKPQAQIAAGINMGWCRKGRNHSFHYIGISLAYEAQYWWKQNQFIRFIDAVIPGDVISTSGDLYLQGLTADFRIEF